MSGDEWDGCECEYCSLQGEPEECWALKRINELKKEIKELKGGKMSIKKEDLENLFTYHPPKNDQASRYEKIRQAGKELSSIIIECCPECDDRDSAIQKIRMAIMSANAAIAINE